MTEYGRRGLPRVRTLTALVLTAATAATAVTVTGGVAGAAPAQHATAPTAVSPAALTTLQHQLDLAARLAQQAAADVLRSDAASASLRISIDDVAAQQQQAQSALAATAVQIYEQAPPDGLPDIESLVIDPGALQGLKAVGNATASSAQGAMLAAQGQLAQVAALAKTSDQLRAGLVAKAVTAYAAQDKARLLIAQMQSALEAQAKAAKAKAARDAATAKLKALAEAKAQLDAQSRQLTLATSPTVSAAGKQALANQKPLLDTLVAAGSGYPPGYHLTGATLTGTASWYGPGFVGRSTSSGVPYDPELLTCAMLQVPLGTVVHVTNLANNASVNVLVSDHGPYVGNRIIDLSHAAAQAIGNSGLATVRIQVLAPGS